MSGARIVSHAKIAGIAHCLRTDTATGSDERLIIETDAALRDLVKELAAFVDGATRGNSGDCEECHHWMEGKTVPHSKDCAAGSLLARARAVIEVGTI
jgi:hypothetical protein